MRLLIDKHIVLMPIEENFIQSVTRDGSYGVSFEIDESTAYFYAVELTGGTQKILDALHIYNNSSLADADRESVVDIAWSDDYRYALLFINKFPHAVFDFLEKQGYNRTGYPDGVSQTGWSQKSKEWNNDIMKQFMD